MSTCLRTRAAGSGLRVANYSGLAGQATWQARRVINWLGRLVVDAASRRLAVQTARELARLDDRQLGDIGLRRRPDGHIVALPMDPPTAGSGTDDISGRR